MERAHAGVATVVIVLGLLVVATAIIFAWYFTPDVLAYLTGNTSLPHRALVGEEYEAAGALFSSLALVGAITAIILQGRAIRLQRREMSRSAEVGLRSLHLQLLMAALGDGDLLDVWTYDIDTENSTARSDIKRELYANLVVSHIETAFVTGIASHAKTQLLLEELFESSITRRYWQNVAPLRRDADVGTNEKAVHDFVVIANTALKNVERRKEAKA